MCPECKKWLPSVTNSPVGISPEHPSSIYSTDSKHKIEVTRSYILNVHRVQELPSQSSKLLHGRDGGKGVGWGGIVTALLSLVSIKVCPFPPPPPPPPPPTPTTLRTPSPIYSKTSYTTESVIFKTQRRLNKSMRRNGTFLAWQ